MTRSDGHTPGNDQPAGRAEAAPVKAYSSRAMVSVVIPARNEQALVEAALSSVLAQRYPLDRLECVVVDNASADQTSEVARAFGAAHPDLEVVVVREPAIGRSSAKNRGARAARGQVLVFLDADSRMEDCLIDDVVAAYQAGSPAGSIRIVADSADRLERGFFDLLEFGKVLFGIRAQMLYCDRSLFLALDGFRPELQLAEDLDLLQRVQRHLNQNGRGTVSHVRSSAIATSPRRLRERPYHLSVLTVFARWALAHAGIGRSRRY